METEIDKELINHKQKKWLIFGGIILLFLLVAVISVEFGSTPKIEMEAIENPVVDTEIMDIGSQGSAPSDSEIWLTQSEGELKSMAEEIKALKALVAAKDEDKSSPSVAVQETLPELPPAPINQPAAIPQLGPGNKPALVHNQGNTIANTQVSYSGPGQSVTNSQAPQNVNQFSGFSRISMTPPEKESDKNSTYLSVSISPARLLTGVSAPTGGNAQKDPQPMLFEITDLSFLPNEFQQSYVGCFVNGVGYGNLSSERVLARVTSLNCVGVDNQAVEVKIDGYVTGPDGGVGIKGKLDDKQGPLLAKALAAGVASGIGSAFSAAGSTTTVSPLGTTTTLKPDQVLKTGSYSGVSNAMEKLADFYMERVNEMYPTINIGAGIEVDIVIKKGLEIQGWRGELND